MLSNNRANDKITTGALSLKFYINCGWIVLLNSLYTVGIMFVMNLLFGFVPLAIAVVAMLALTIYQISIYTHKFSFENNVANDVPKWWIVSGSFAAMVFVFSMLLTTVTTVGLICLTILAVAGILNYVAERQAAETKIQPASVETPQTNAQSQSTITQTITPLVITSSQQFQAAASTLNSPTSGASSTTAGADPQISLAGAIAQAGLMAEQAKNNFVVDAAKGLVQQTITNITSGK